MFNFCFKWGIDYINISSPSLNPVIMIQLSKYEWKYSEVQKDIGPHNFFVQHPQKKLDKKVVGLHSNTC